VLRALWLKEWKQLRWLRRLGLALALLLPLVCVGAAEAGRQGWLPAKITSYSPRTLFVELVPALLIALGGLLALLFSCQSFAGDRAQGTESFLLERPVPRSRVWLARLAASLASTLLLLVVLAAYAWTVAEIAASPSAADWPLEPRLMLGLGLLVAIVAFLAGVLGASFVASPMQAVLLGLVLMALPLGLGSLLTGLFPLARYRLLPVGAALPAVLLAGYLVVSFVVSCRGEPAGRGRWLRGTLALGLAVALLPLVFSASAPLAMRLDAARLASGVRIARSPAGPGALAVGGEQRSGWILDVDRREIVRFLGPPVFDARWSADGSRVAVVHAAGTMGGFSYPPRVDVFDRRGSRIGRLEARTDYEYIGRVHWAGAHLLVGAVAPGRGSVLVIGTPASGEARLVPVDAAFRDWRLLGPTTRGELFLLSRDGRGAGRTQLRRVNVERGELESPRLIEEGPLLADPGERFLHFYRFTLSPGGRYLQRGAGTLLDLRSGEELTVADGGEVAWVDGERMAWIESGSDGQRLLLAAPGDEARELRSWSGQGLLELFPSPDRRRVMVKRYTDDGIVDDAFAFSFIDGRRVPSDERLEALWIYDLETDRWTDGSAWVGGPGLERGTRLAWIAGDSIAVTGSGFLALGTLEAPHELHDLIGGRSRP
jgi:hypothetical protein